MLAKTLAGLDNEVKKSLEIQGVSNDAAVAYIQLLFRTEAISKGIVDFLVELHGPIVEGMIYQHIAQSAEDATEVLDGEMMKALAEFFGLGDKDENNGDSENL